MLPDTDRVLRSGGGECGGISGHDVHLPVVRVRKVMWVEPADPLNDDFSAVTVSMSVPSAVIEARRWMDALAVRKSRRGQWGRSDSEVLEEFMIVHWAWFDED